ncbi:MAG: penicillin-binding protein 2 [Clostridia bacterium]|nr:penicillin-binding protein 2 [Clostridia bacterium]
MTFNKKAVYVLMAMLIFFSGVVLYFTYFQIFKSASLANASTNPRTFAREQSVKRGSIYDRTGVCLVESEMEADGQRRVHHYDSLYAQLIGYSDPRYQRSLLEASFNSYILGGAEADFVETLLGIEDTEGSDLHLTVDHRLQKLASDALGGRKGAVVALDPISGEVLCMVSNPTYNPNTLSEDYETLSKTPGMFYPRATSWNYAPGSIFKIITAAAAIENGLDSTVYEDTEPLYIDGHPIYNYGKKTYGTLDMETAFSKSSNTYFAHIADMLGADKLRKTAESFGFNTEIPFDIPFRESKTLSGSPSKAEVAAVGYGQGQTTTSPLHMAMVASAIANDGIMMQPYLVSRAEKDGKAVYEQSGRILRRATSSTTAQKVGEMMQETVKSGTATGAYIPDISVAAKTGTAETEGQKDHAWFVAYAPAENPKIALAIVLENSGSTGSACAGMARDLISNWLRR